MLKLSVLALILYLNCGIVFCSSDEPLPEIDTSLGRVRGFWKTSVDGRKYAAFEGIPYAKPPVGLLRFEEPQPATPWSGVWEATNLYTCSQSGLLSFDIQGEEDCLYLNVYIPAQFVDAPKNLDVVVLIHGGGFMIGSGHSLARSEFFMDRDIILVTINYRLGLFGFLSTEDDVIPGNNGLKDQVLALKWVKDNIVSFGGNPHSVTILGLSAGGASVHFHYFSPLSIGLFQRGMSLSGTALAPWVIKENPLENAKKLAVLLGCPDKSTIELKRCLQQRPALHLLKHMEHFYGFNMAPFCPFGPVVEKGSGKPFLDREPYLLLKEGNVIDAPWVSSHTSEDGLLPSALYYADLDEIDEKWVEIAHYVLDYNHTLVESQREKVAKEILEYYLGPGQRISKENFKQFTQIFTDRLFGVPGEVAAKMQARVTKSPVYYYLFNYREGVNKAVKLLTKSPEVKGVTHGEDGIYFFGFLADEPFSNQDKRLKEAFHDMLYTFASTGKPSFDGTENWKPTGHLELTYLNVSGPDHLTLQKIKSLTASDFWTNLGLLENENLFVKDEL